MSSVIRDRRTTKMLQNLNFLQHFSNISVNISMRTRYVKSEEKKLIHQVLKGHKDAFRTLVENYKNLVAHIVFRMINGTEDQEDVCQDIFIKIYENISNFRLQSKLSTWIGRITYNTCLNYLEKKRALICDDVMTEKFSSNAFENSFLADVVEADIKEKLLFEVDRLPEIYRVIITLYHLEGMKYQDISQVLDKPVGTIKSYLYRARQELRIALQKRYHKEELV